MTVIHRVPRPAPNGAACFRAPRHEVNDGTGMRAMIAHGIAEARAWGGADQGVRIIDTSAAA
ncbi:glyoxalase [Burkholderia ambifaria]|nr:glyoxalase [Burkholderia ambifaria]